MKLLINDVDGFQKIIEIDNTGSYFDPSRVLWNDKTDGPFPAGTVDKLGGLTKQGGSLVYDDALKQDHESRKTTKKNQENSLKSKISSSVDYIKNVDITKPFNSNDLEILVKHIVTSLRHT